MTVTLLAQVLLVGRYSQSPGRYWQYVMRNLSGGPVALLAYFIYLLFCHVNDLLKLVGFALSL
jgi:hypothetical protein